MVGSGVLIGRSWQRAEPIEPASAATHTIRDLARGADLGATTIADPGPAASSTGDAAGTPMRADQLAELGYLDAAATASERVGVTVHDPSRAAAGWNLFSSGHSPDVFLMDMDGRLVHRWKVDLGTVFPDAAASVQGYRRLGHPRRVFLFADGDLLVLYAGIGLVRLDVDSAVRWTHAADEHHDLCLDEAGRIHVLTRRNRRLARYGDEELIDDFVTVLDADGRDLEEFSILECLERSDYVSLLWRSRRAGDLLHTNTIELLDGRHAARNPAFQGGHYLLSLRNLDTVVVVDPRRRAVVWALRGLFRQQHQPTFLADGHLLLFDNEFRPGCSRVLEIDPLTQRIVWQYPPQADGSLYSEFRGSNQRLDNGNTLITESDRGRVLEVTPDGAVVWEYVNPQTLTAEERAAGPEYTAVIPELIRLPPGSLNFLPSRSR